MRRHSLLAALAIAISATSAFSQGTASNRPVATQKSESVKAIAQALLKQGSIIVKSPPKLGSTNDVLQGDNSIQSVHMPEYTYALFHFDSEWEENDLPKEVVGAVEAQIEIELNRKLLAPAALHSVSLDGVFDAFEKEVQEAWDAHKFREFLENAPRILHDRIKEAIEGESVTLTVGNVSKEFHGTVQFPSSITDLEKFDVTVVTSPPGGSVSVLSLTAYLIAKKRTLPTPWHTVVQQPLSVSGSLHYKVVWPDGKIAESDTVPITKSGTVT